MSISRRRVVAVVAVLIALAVLIWLVAFREEAPPTPDTGSVPSETVPGNNESAGADPVDETAAMPPVAGAIPPAPEIPRQAPQIAPLQARSRERALHLPLRKAAPRW